jgi:hypothetical protein
MTATLPLPALDAVKRLLTGIVGKEIAVKKALPLDLNASAPRVYGTYVNAKTDEVCLCVMDYPLAAFSGGAMMTFPKDVVNEAIKGIFSEGLLDALHEILNVLAGLFHTSSHVSLEQFCLKRGELQEHAAALLNSPAQRLDIEVSIEHWGAGRMTLLLGHKKPMSQ